MRTAKVPSTPDDPARAVDAGLERMRRGARRRPGRRRDDGRDQRGHPAPRAARRLHHQRRLRGRAVHRADGQGAALRPALAEAEAAGRSGAHSIGVGRSRRPSRRRDRAAGRGRSSTSCRHRLRTRSTRRSAVAVCLLFSYLRPAATRTGARGGRRGGCPARRSRSRTRSRRVWREYERASTTIADAFVKPVVDRLRRRRRRDRLRDALGAAPLEPARLQRRLPAARDQARAAARRSCCSRGSPAASSAARLLRRAGRACRSVFTLDMGGTSCDIGLVLDGEPAVRDRVPARLRAFRSRSRASPCARSAPAAARSPGSTGAGCCTSARRARAPSPGRSPTAAAAPSRRVTDANLVLGRLDPAYFLGGDDGARRSTPRARRLGPARAERSGLIAEQAALAVVRTADENMANAIRLIAVERGLDPRELRADRLRRRRPAARPRGRRAARASATVLVPPHPGLCSALRRRDRRGPRRPCRRPTSLRSDDVDVDALAPRRAAAARGRGRRAAAQRRRRRAGRSRRSADLRYAGQNYELEVPLPDGELDERGWAALLERFERDARARSTASRSPGEPVELINLRVTASAAEPPPRRADASRAARAREPARAGLVRRRRPVDCPIVPRASARAGRPRSTGPAVIEETGLDHARLRPATGSSCAPSGVLVAHVGSARVSDDARARQRRPARPAQRAREHRRRDGARDDEDVLLDDLQRGPRLLDRAARPRGQPDRREELHARR